MAIVLSTSSQNTLFWSILLKKKRTKFQIFDHKPWTELFGKIPIFSPFSNRWFFSLKWLDFYLQGHKTLCFGLFAEKQKRAKFLIFYQKVWTNPFWKMTNFRLFKSMFFNLKWLDFYLQGHRTLCFRLVCWKTKRGQTSQFLTKTHALTPLKKCKFSPI